MLFPTSGVEVNPLIPVLVAFLVSALTAPAGVSGAFLLLPFQVSVLGFTSPAVSPTNLIYNIIATPGGVYRYIREGRVVWPLAWLVILGTLPGVFIGAVLRVTILSNAAAFKVFIGFVLLYFGIRLLWETVGRRAAKRKCSEKEAGTNPTARAFPATEKVRTTNTSPRKLSYVFQGRTYTVKMPAIFLLCLTVGVIGGIYSIGGGSIIAPLLVMVFELPIYTIAGATMLATLVSSLTGVASFEVLAAAHIGTQAAPDWLLGALLGIGGLAGTYVGARLQRFLPEFWIRAVLGVLVTLLAASYII
ncbi:MAG: sulfite exporter TauE/SafE family protein [Rubrobacter sp.]|nr:sulfite exporter TauE/SafE family protein [Rubrobacter sp.]